MRSARKNMLNIAFGISLLLSPFLTQGQTPDSYTCKSNFDTIVNFDCQFVLDPYLFLEGEPNIPNLQVFVFDKNPANREIIDCPDSHTYTITNEKGAILCTGVINLIDQTAPQISEIIQTKDTLECIQINRILNNPSTTEAYIDGQANKYYLGEVKFEENCSDCNCEMTSKFLDNVDFFACEELPYYAKITRKWTATDCNNLITEVEQYFYLVRPSLDSLIKVEDKTFSTCDPDTIALEDYFPYWIDCFGDQLFVNHLDCNFDISIEESVNEICGATGLVIDRYVKAFDFCLGQSIYLDTFQIRIGDFNPPIIEGNIAEVENRNLVNYLNDNIGPDSFGNLVDEGQVYTFFTGPFDCTAGFSTQLGDLEDQFDFESSDCAQLEANLRLYEFERNTTNWVNREANVTNAMITGLGPGFYALQILLNDQCLNQKSVLSYFEVRDEISPNLSCLSDLELPLINNGDEIRGRIYATNLSPNRSDNCEIKQILIRRPVADINELLPDLLNSGFDSNQDGLIDESDFFDNNGNQIQDVAENNWELINGTWYSPWAPYVDFYCQDIGQNIIVEIKASDRFVDPITGEDGSNYSFCNSEIRIISNFQASLNPIADISLSCGHSILDDLKEGSYFSDQDASYIHELNAAFGNVLVQNDPCQESILEQNIQSELDQCGFGYIYRRVNIKGDTLNAFTQKIKVEEAYDYWIQFPKDIESSCDLDLIEAGKLNTSENSCDLLAISYKDEYFYGIQESNPEACFKIFRTYQIINWCEYNGSSAPVVVSRDWDYWNGEKCNSQYNVNPKFPDGNNTPGDNDLFVIVKRNFADTIPDTVYYDADANPHNQHPDNEATTNIKEGYYWKVISGYGPIEEPAYGVLPIDCNPGEAQMENVWGADIKEDFDSTNNDTLASNDNPRFGSFGYWQYTQHISIIDNSYPEIAVKGERFICANSSFLCSTLVSLEVSASDDCVGSGGLEIKVYLDEDSDGENIEDLSEFLVDGVFNANIDIGSHQIIVSANDNCGNVTNSNFAFTIRDCLAPKPECQESFLTTLMPSDTGSAAVTVWAADLLASTSYDCSGQGPDFDDRGRLEVKDISINKIGEPAIRNQEFLTLDCSNLSEGLLVEVHAWDEQNLHDFCYSLISLSDDLGACPTADTGSIRGIIKTEAGIAVPGVNINLSVNALAQGTVLGNEEGEYQFNHLATDQVYTITPELDLNYLQGVTTYDILLIQKHILGEELLTSPYQLIAADINNSKAVSTLDIIELSKVILNKSLKFEKNTSWRFIPTDFEFTNPEVPWNDDFPEFYQLDDLLNNPSSFDFIGIKIGDINGSAQSGSNLRILEQRSNNPFLISYPDQLLEAGKQYRIPLNLEWKNLEGLQFSLYFDHAGLTIQQIESDYLSEQNYKIDKNKGQVNISWLNRKGLAQAQEAPLLYLILEAEQSMLLSDYFGLEERTLVPEAYINDQIYSVKIEASLYESFKIAQNFPNPFKVSTNIEIELSQEEELFIEIFDAKGVRLVSHKKHYTRGKHQFLLNAEQLNGAGIYFYKISNGKGSQCKRMIYF